MNNMNTKPTKTYTVEDLYEFYYKGEFPEYTIFNISITERMNGEDKTKIYSTYDFKKIMKIIAKQAKDYNLYDDPITYWRDIFIDGHTLVIDFGSWLYFGKVKVEYPN